MLCYSMRMSAKIALIEDDDNIREMYRLKLEEDGFTVKTAKNGKEGLDMLKSFWPDVVLLDLIMPEMNGEEMLLELRAKDWGKDFKVVIMTNTGREEAPASMNNLGITRYVVKAEQTPAQVEDIVKSILSEKEKQQTHTESSS
jgi:two-component system, OmpR family, alkaline phosphatase synthesis response regulator PhoP